MRSRQSGFNLVELVMFIVIVGVALAGIMAVYTRSVSSSANPFIRQRTVAVASAYMDEILRKRWNENSPVGGGCVVTGGGSCPAEGAPAWQPLTAYNAGDFVTPVAPDGCYFQTSGSGTSGAAEPAWPVTPALDGSATDNGLTWVCVAMDDTAVLGAEAGETRAAYDDIDDYGAIVGQAPTDQTGSAMPGYGGTYAVTVTVQPVAAFAGIAQADTLQITVAVTNPLGEQIRLTAFRLNY